MPPNVRGQWAQQPGDGSFGRYPLKASAASATIAELLGSICTDLVRRLLHPADGNAFDLNPS